ncbi:hypothetical protein FHW58_000704 [Duganella sp. 1224]|uniref:hypothetical protein n=1 Tax=Duganella sp. 1224 TaxID=2587052 RepID=UPI0015CD588E|nr:hypothetical protein [Duganella sp. 1224]NYE59552.1 hypothetical protein [Duganella sp. 1224]
MRILFVALLATHTLAAGQQRNEPAIALTDDIIRKAVRETIAEDPRPLPSSNAQAGAFRANPVEARMSAAFEQAKVPDCLHPDALKLQPAQIGPVAVVGPYSLPWVIAAAARGKCR